MLSSVVGAEPMSENKRDKAHLHGALILVRKGDENAISKQKHEMFPMIKSVMKKNETEKGVRNAGIGVGGSLK